jgi:thioredoxin-like negative regulator of GroEL
MHLDNEDLYNAKFAFSDAIDYDDKFSTAYYNLWLTCMDLWELENARDALVKFVEIENDHTSMQVQHSIELLGKI